MRLNPTATSHVRHDSSPTGQAMTSKAPSAVATPLPPRNINHTGAMWPMTAAAAAVTAMSGPYACATATEMPPLPASSTRVMAASFLLPARRTLIVPILPEPILRMSPSPMERLSSRPKGTEPTT